MNRNIILAIKIIGLGLLQFWLVNQIYTAFTSTNPQVHDVLWIVPIIVVPFICHYFITSNIRVGDSVNVYQSFYGPIDYKLVAEDVTVTNIIDDGFEINGRRWFSYEGGGYRCYMHRVYNTKNKNTGKFKI